jgi:type II secretory pathway pseudopilin PulG
MNPNCNISRHRTGFIMIEIMLAMTVFGMCAVGLMKALSVTTRLAVESQLDAQLMLRLQSRITEISKLPDLTQWKDKSESSPKDEAGIWMETSVEELKDFKNEDGQEVTQMYKIYVKAFYTVDWKAEPEMQDAVVWRYLPLYKPVAGGAPAAPAQ